MDQSVGPVANGYTNARTNKLTLTHTQVKCFNSCQKTCKTRFAFRFLQPSSGPSPRRVSAQPGGEAQHGQMDGGTEGWRRRAAASQSGGGCAGAGRFVRWPQTKARGGSHHPWHVPPWRGREEEQEPRRDAVEKRTVSRAGGICGPPRSPCARRGGSDPAAHQAKPTLSYMRCMGWVTSRPAPPQELREPKDRQDKAPGVISYLLTN